MGVLRGAVVEAAAAGLAGAADVFPFEPAPVERADGFHAGFLPLREFLHLVAVPEDDRDLGPDIVGRRLAFLALIREEELSVQWTQFERLFAAVHAVSVEAEVDEHVLRIRNLCGHRRDTRDDPDRYLG